MSVTTPEGTCGRSEIFGTYAFCSLDPSKGVGWGVTHAGAKTGPDRVTDSFCSTCWECVTSVLDSARGSHTGLDICPRPPVQLVATGALPRDEHRCYCECVILSQILVVTASLHSASSPDNNHRRGERVAGFVSGTKSLTRKAASWGSCARSMPRTSAGEATSHRSRRPRLIHSIQW